MVEFSEPMNPTQGLQIKETVFFPSAEKTQPELITTIEESTTLAATLFSEGQLDPDKVPEESKDSVNRLRQAIISADQEAKKGTETKFAASSYNPETLEYSYLTNEGNQKTDTLQPLDITRTLKVIDSLGLSPQAKQYFETLAKHTGVKIDGEIVPYLKADQTKITDQNESFFVAKKGVKPPPEKPTTTTEETPTVKALSEFDIQTIYHLYEQAGISPNEGEKWLTLVDKFRKEGFPAILSDLVKLEKTSPSSRQSRLKFIQGVWQELTGQAPPEDITNPSQLFINLLQNETAVEKLAPLFPDNPTWRDKLQAVKDKKGIRIALGVLGKGKPDLYKTVLIMTLFQMYEASQERE